MGGWWLQADTDGRELGLSTQRMSSKGSLPGRGGLGTLPASRIYVTHDGPGLGGALSLTEVRCSPQRSRSGLRLSWESHIDPTGTGKRETLGVWIE